MLKAITEFLTGGGIVIASFIPMLHGDTWNASIMLGVGAILQFDSLFRMVRS